MSCREVMGEGWWCVGDNDREIGIVKRQYFMWWKRKCII